MKYLITLIALVLPTYLVRFKIFGLPSTLLEVFIYLGFIIGLVLMIWQRQYPDWKKIKTYILPVALMIVAVVISVIISPQKLAALGQLRAFFLAPILVFFISATFLKKDDLRLVLGGLVGSGVFVSLHTIFLKKAGQVTADGRVIGIFGYNPNYLAFFLAPIGILILGYSVQGIASRKYWQGILGGILLILNIMALYFSGSRGGIVALGGGISFYLLVKYWNWIKGRIWAKVGVALLIIIAISGLWLVFRPNFRVSPEQGGRVTSSNNIRWQIWGASLELVKKHPILGVGLANFQNAFDELTKDRVNFSAYITPLALTPHNIFLMWWLTTGIMGLGAFIWLLVAFFWQGLKNTDTISFLLMAMMATLLIQGLVDTPYFKNDLSVMFWFLMAFMLLLKKD